MPHENDQKKSAIVMCLKENLHNNGNYNFKETCIKMATTMQQENFHKDGNQNSKKETCLRMATTIQQENFYSYGNQNLKRKPAKG